MKPMWCVAGILCVAGLAVSAGEALETKTKPEKTAPTTVERSPGLGTPSTTPPGGARAQWDLQWSFSAHAAAQPGVETDGVNIYTSTWNATTLSRYQMDGTWLADFTIAGVTSIRDMAYDGTYFYGSDATMNLRVMNLAAGTLVNTIVATCSGITGIRHIAYDPTLNGGAGGFWIGNWDELGAITMTGAQIYPNIAGNANCYGSAYDPYSDPAHPRLLLYQQSGTSLVEIHGFDIGTQTYQGLLKDATDVPGYTGGGVDMAGGLCIHEDTGSGLALLIGSMQHDPNVIFAYELAVLADPSAPGAPTGLVVTPDPGGALQAQVSWTNPSVTVGGAPLAELLTVVLDVDGTPAYTNPAPVIGGPESQLATVVSAGQHTFTVTGTNSAGTGLPAADTAWVGEDVPAAPQNATLAVVTSTANVTWTAPAAGLHGGYYSGTGVTYDVLRNGTVLVADNTPSTSFSETLVAPGNYFYTIVASNGSGEGGSATTNSVVYGYLFYEPFDAAGIPAGWSVDGLGGTNWSVVATNNAGGTPNELQFYYNPTFTGVSRMVTPPFTTAGSVSLTLSFKHAVSHYTTPYTLRVVTTSDGGTTYNEVWNVAPTGNINPTTRVISIANADVGSATFQIGFVFDGYSYNINDWWIDDVEVVGVVPVELMSFSVE